MYFFRFYFHFSCLLYCASAGFSDGGGGGGFGLVATIQRSSFTKKMEDVKLLLLEVKMSYICKPGPMINNFILLVKATELKLPHRKIFSNSRIKKSCSKRLKTCFFVGKYTIWKSIFNEKHISDYSISNMKYFSILLSMETHIIFINFIFFVKIIFTVSCSMSSSGTTFWLNIFLGGVKILYVFRYFFL